MRTLVAVGASLLAAAGACVGIGMNRWRQGQPRTIQHPPA